VVTGLGRLRLLSGRRMDLFERADGVTVIDDSYNANPVSMSAALHALADFGRDTGEGGTGDGGMGDGHRRFAVLGYMAELGEYERAGHASVGELAAKLGIDRVIVVGESARPIHDGAMSVGGWPGTSVVVPDQDAAIAELHADLRAGDVVLVKGSRYRTWQVIDSLREPAPGAEASGGRG
jgi:UDP-N-acetylmuramoyl-tripeptide--D-alanyl-D-alanine ligase